MYRRLLQLLMLVILAQSTLAAADAHVLHEVTGEASHQHLFGDNTLDAHKGVALKTADAPHDSDVGDEQSCHHHCCHGHNFKYLNESLTLAVLAPDLITGWGYAAHYVPPLVAPEFRPPII